MSVLGVKGGGVGGVEFGNGAGVRGVMVVIVGGGGEEGTGRCWMWPFE